MRQKLRKLSDQIISLAHKVNYSFEITREDLAERLIREIVAYLKELLKEFD